jgi:hypothetical protein
MIPLAKPGQGIRWRGHGSFFPKHGFETFNDQILDGGAAAGSGYLGSSEDPVG